jgi:hypothetical protein
MKNQWILSLLTAVALFVCSCASTSSVRKTWKSADYTGGTVPSVAVLAVTERGLIRTGLENRFANELERTGQVVVRSHNLLALGEIKEDQDAAAAALVKAGAQTVLITRLIANEAEAYSVRVGDERYAPITTGFGSGLPYAGYGWGGYYTLAFQNMGTVWSSNTERVFLETSLFDLVEGKLLWSCYTDTVLQETSDYVAEIIRLAELVADALREDGMVK